MVSSFFFSTAVATVLLAMAGCAVDADSQADQDAYPTDATSADIGAEGLEAFPGQTGEVRTDLFDTGDGFVSFEYALIEDFRVMEGDILLPEPVTETLSIEPSDTSNLIAITGHRWKNGVVPYTIPANFPRRARILGAMSAIEDKAGIKFVQRSGQADFITFRRSTGCASYVGRQGGRQIIYLADACSRGNTIHELLHALGVYHEQSRPNRDDHVRIRWANIRDGHAHNFQKVSASKSRAYSGYNVPSIMHYSSYAFSKNGRPTIVRNDGRLIGYHDQMSQKDANALLRMYP